MSQQKKLEKVLDLLLSEDNDRAAELLHQIIVEKARTIYETIVDEEELNEVDMEEGDMEEAELDEDGAEFDEVGGEPSKDFSDRISTDIDDIETDEHHDGEVPSDESMEEIEDHIEDIESTLHDELESLRAKFASIMGDESDAEEDSEADSDDDEDAEEFDENEDEGEYDSEDQQAEMYEKKKHEKMEVAKQTKKQPKGARADEETQFLTKVADTGQKSKAGLVGAGTHSQLGAEQTKSAFTNPPAKRSYGGEPVDFGKGTGGEYGKYHGEHADDETPSDNVDVEPKKSSVKADTTAKYTGGKAAGEGGSKSPFTKKPGGQV